jgi:ATP-binding cassette subfamily B protein
MGGVLLLAYWALNLPFLGQEIALVARDAARQRNISLRLDELLSAPEVALDDAAQGERKPGAGDDNAPAPPGVSITLENVTVRAGGHTVLDRVDLDIPSGCHLAIVGPSGAGKSTLVGLLLGWHQAAEGRVTIDGSALDHARLTELRRVTAWVDPAVHVWNRSLLDNLRYGAAPEEQRLDEVLDGALLSGVLKQLPDGLLTTLGEGGARLSGGEGQRVRLGRAMIRQGARLVVLDEPFTGLDREQRRLLLGRARARWRRATIMLVTHDVGDTLDLDRVIVIEGGRVIEDGAPQQVAAARGSRYSQLLAAEEMVRRGLWSSQEWRRIRLEHGVLVEEGKAR